MRHYTVFLSEDSDDEFQQEEDPVSGFSENFFFSAPFEWSILYSFIVLIRSLNNSFCIGQGACSYTWDFGNTPAVLIQHLMNVPHFSCLFVLVFRGMQSILLHESVCSNAQLYCFLFNPSCLGGNPSTCPLFQCAACVPVQTFCCSSLYSASCACWIVLWALFQCSHQLFPVSLAWSQPPCSVKYWIPSDSGESSCRRPSKGLEYNLTLNYTRDSKWLVEFTHCITCMQPFHL